MEQNREAYMAKYNEKTHFYGRIGLWIGIILLVVGIVIYAIGKKTEGPQLKPLQAARKQTLDNMIRDLHDGKLSGDK